jgi:hypothetical protein
MRRALLAALVLVLALAACGTVEQAGAPRSPPAATAAPASSAQELIAYVGRLRGMSDGALGAEAARQKRAGGDGPRVKAALALSLVATSDEAEIIALVDPVARSESADPGLRAMASYVQALAADRRHLKESSSGTQSRLAAERRAAETQRQRADALQQKLDALTDLERSLADRAAGH